MTRPLATALPASVILRGEDQIPVERRALRAGPLSLLWEQGHLMYVRYGDREIIRRLYVAVRDRNWGTIPGKIANFEIAMRGDSFEIEFDCRHRETGIDFLWAGHISGTANGSIIFSMDGEALSDFLRNRIGFCLLHPPDCAGRACTVEANDGKIEHRAFPLEISPAAPMVEMRAISYDAAPGVTAEIRFEGDIFEMEDHRNWTDASFKTFCTPLRLPFPVAVARGECIAQSVSLSLRGSGKAPSAGRAGPFTVTVGQRATATFPQLGLCVASDGLALSASQVERLRVVRPSHLRVDIDPHQPRWQDALERAAREATAIGCGLEVALFGALGNTRIAAPSAPVVRWLLFPPDPGNIAWVRRHLAGAVCGGNDAYFAELNRDRPPAELLDGICYSINPQIHAFDDASLVENLSAQATTVVNAKRLALGKPVITTPVTLKPRRNVVATGPEVQADLLPSQVDPRQMSLFGAAWTLGSLKYLAEAGAASATYYETVGWRGIMEREEGSPRPDRFRSIPGSVFPLYHVFAAVAGFQGASVLPTTSNEPLAVDALAINRDGRLRLLVANLRIETSAVNIQPSLPGLRIVWRLNEESAIEAMTSPERFASQPWRGTGSQLTLSPCEVVCLETEMPG